MISKEVGAKIKHILREIATKKGESMHTKIVDNSTFEFKDISSPRSQNEIYKLTIYTSPNVFYEYFDFKYGLQKEVQSRINRSTEYFIDSVDLIIDLNKLEVNHINVVVVQTQWEEINELQNKLVESLKTSVDSVDYQNIGNTSRTILDKLAREVFNKEKHLPANPLIELHNGKFKNQLNTYIATELAGKANKELRRIVESSINLVSDSIDGMNKTTHKLDADKRFAEICVISTISVINLIKTISDKAW